MSNKQPGIDFQNSIEKNSNNIRKAQKILGLSVGLTTASLLFTTSVSAEEVKTDAKITQTQSLAADKSKEDLARAGEDKQALAKAEEEKAALAKAEEEKAVLAKVEEEKAALAKVEEEKATLAKVEEEKAALAKASEEKKNSTTRKAKAKTTNLAAAAATVVTPESILVSPDGEIVSGEGTIGNTIVIYSAMTEDGPGVEVGRGVVVAAESGTWGYFSVTLTIPQKNSELVYAIAFDENDGQSEESIRMSAPDLTPPDAPSGLSIVGEGNYLEGNAQAGSTVEVLDEDGNSLAVGTASSEGNFSLRLDRSITDGELVKVQASDPGGTSPETPVAGTFDTIPPLIKATINPLGTIVTGTTEPKIDVEIFDENKNSLGTAKSDDKGFFTVNLLSPQTKGQKLLAVATDPTGNEGDDPVDAPLIEEEVKLAITASIDGKGTIVSGKTTAGLTVTIFDSAGNPIGSDVADGDGNYRVTLTTPQTKGQLLTAKVKNSAKKEATAEVKAPLIEDEVKLEITAKINSKGTIVSGKTTAGLTVTIFDSAGNPIGSDVADGDGNYRVTLTTPQTNGQILLVKTEDDLGNRASTEVTAPEIIVIEPEVEPGPYNPTEDEETSTEEDKSVPVETKQDENIVFLNETKTVRTIPTEAAKSTNHSVTSKTLPQTGNQSVKFSTMGLIMVLMGGIVFTVSKRRRRVE